MMNSSFHFIFFLFFSLHGGIEAFTPSSRFSSTIYHPGPPETRILLPRPASSANVLYGTLIDSGDVISPSDKQQGNNSVKAKNDSNNTVAAAEEKESVTEISKDLILDEEELDMQTILDIEMMQKAIQMARSR
jgi:hypothetical protein